MPPKSPKKPKSPTAPHLITYHQHFILNYYEALHPRRTLRLATARRLGIRNTPSDLAIASLNALVDNILDPLREAFGRPIVVTSGFRCRRLNAEVGGARNSQHLRGQAADIIGGSRDENRRLFQLARQLNLPFDQLINEQDFRWIHISYVPGRGRKQVIGG